MSQHEIARRLVDGVWQTVDVVEDGGGGGGGQSDTNLTILTADDLYDLDNTPVEIVPAPGANKMLLPESILYHYKPGATAFGSNVNIAWQWGDDAFGTANTTSVTVNLTGGESITLHLPHDDIDNHSGDPINLVNQPLRATSTIPPLIPGPIATSHISSGGDDYAPGDTGTLTQSPNGSGATYVVDTVDGFSAITAYTITAPGTGYITGQTASLVNGGAQPGVGVLGEIIVDTVAAGTPADGTVEVTVVYKTIDLTLA